VIDPLDRWREHGEKPDYAGLLTFGALPYTQDPAELAGVDVAIVGAPTDDLVSDRPGARFGPRAIRAASCPPGAHLEAKVDAMAELRMVDYGDAPVVPADAARTHEAIERTVGEVVAAGAIPVVLGRDHSIAEPDIRAVAARHGPVGLVHFDTRGAVPVRREHEQPPTVGAAEHGREAGAAEVDPLEHFTALADSGAVVRHVRARGPDAAVRVETDAVRADSVRPDATVRQGAVVLDVEGGEACGKGLGDDERLVVRRDDHAVGEGELVRHLARGGLFASPLPDSNRRPSLSWKFTAGTRVHGGAFAITFLLQIAPHGRVDRARA
jgi:hypothetical protein